MTLKKNEQDQVVHDRTPLRWEDALPYSSLIAKFHPHGLYPVWGVYRVTVGPSGTVQASFSESGGSSEVLYSGASSTNGSDVLPGDNARSAAMQVAEEHHIRQQRKYRSGRLNCWNVRNLK